VATQNTMVFWRDDDEGLACLEYSWVPMGAPRKLIQLPPLVDEDSRKDPIPKNTNISQVQVYRLVCNRLGIDDKLGWLFPAAGAPHNSEIIYATIQVFESRKYILGTAYFADGSSAADYRPLRTAPLPCPEVPGH
jgi:hypothetical protein